jgi:hypothetical protein
MLKTILSFAILAASLVSASAATKPHRAPAEAAATNAIPGYAKDGGVTSVPNPDQSGQQNRQ